MIGLPSAVRIFFSRRSTDLRKSFDGLMALARDFLGQDPRSGHVFVFRNRSGDRVKLLYWDRTGLCILYKRLERGFFRFPEVSDDAPSVEVSSGDLMLILEGLDLSGARRQRRRIPDPRSVVEREQKVTQNH